MILGVVRHALTFVGGVILMKGWATESEIQELTGALITVIGGVWSVLEKRK